MSCNNNCNRLCRNLIISTSITVVAVDGVDTLVIDIPASTYRNFECFCIVTAQSIPDTATINMPVAISIGGDTTTVYPLVCSKTCLQAVACQVNSRRKYKVIVSTNTDSGVFKAIYGLTSYCPTVLDSLPVVEATPAVASLETPTLNVVSTTRKTAPKKEVVENA